MITVRIPMTVPSAANLAEHWAAKARRTKANRSTTAMFVRNAVPGPFSLPVRVTLTRAAPCPLDDDNLAAAFKAVRDGVADGLGLPNDRHGVTWTYMQVKAKEPSILIQIESASAPGGPGLVEMEVGA